MLTRASADHPPSAPDAASTSCNTLSTRAVHKCIQTVKLHVLQPDNRTRARRNSLIHLRMTISPMACVFTRTGVSQLLFSTDFSGQFWPSTCRQPWRPQAPSDVHKACGQLALLPPFRTASVTRAHRLHSPDSHTPTTARTRNCQCPSQEWTVAAGIPDEGAAGMQKGS